MVANKKNPAWGGKRDGAGRPSKGYKIVSIRMTEEEKMMVKEFLNKIREQPKEEPVIEQA